MEYEIHVRDLLEQFGHQLNITNVTSIIIEKQVHSSIDMYHLKIPKDDVNTTERRLVLKMPRQNAPHSTNFNQVYKMKSFVEFCENHSVELLNSEIHFYRLVEQTKKVHSVKIELKLQNLYDLLPEFVLSGNYHDQPFLILRDLYENYKFKPAHSVLFRDNAALTLIYLARGEASLQRCLVMNETLQENGTDILEKNMSHLFHVNQQNFHSNAVSCLDVTTANELILCAQNALDDLPNNQNICRPFLGPVNGEFWIKNLAFSRNKMIWNTHENIKLIEWKYWTTRGCLVKQLLPFLLFSIRSDDLLTHNQWDYYIRTFFVTYSALVRQMDENKDISLLDVQKHMKKSLNYAVLWIICRFDLIQLNYSHQLNDALRRLQQGLLFFKD